MSAEPSALSAEQAVANATRALPPQLKVESWSSIMADALKRQQESDEVLVTDGRFIAVGAYEQNMHVLFWAAGWNVKEVHRKFVETLSEHPLGKLSSAGCLMTRGMQLVCTNKTTLASARLPAGEVSFLAHSHLIVNELMEHVHKRYTTTIGKTQIVDVVALWYPPSSYNLILQYGDNAKKLAYYDAASDTDDFGPPAKKRKSLSLEKQCETASSRTDLLRLQTRLCNLQSELITKLGALHECCVCKERSCNRVCNPCGHTFCDPCIVRLMSNPKKECPLCRRRIESVIVEHS